MKASCELPHHNDTTNTAGAVSNQYHWLLKKAEELILRSRCENREGISYEMVSSPGGYYQAMFTRDMAYKVIACPHLYANDKTEGTLQLVLDNASYDHAMPEYITIDGRVEYWCAGTGPLTDNAPSYVMATIAYCTAVNNFEFLHRNIDKIKQCLDSVRVCPATNLVWIDPHNPHSGYGYHDNIQKTGTELFSSVLLYQAYKILAEHLDGSIYGRIKDDCAAKAVAIEKGLESLYDEKSGLYMAASIDCRQPDVWGSAAAVFYGAAGKHGRGCAQALANMHDKCVWKGQIRQIPQPFVWDR